MDYGKSSKQKSAASNISRGLVWRRFTGVQQDSLFHINSRSDGILLAPYQW